MTTSERIRFYENLILNSRTEIEKQNDLIERYEEAIVELMEGNYEE